MALTLARALRLTPFQPTDGKAGPISSQAHDRAVSVAFVGAGGKTSAMFELARSLGGPALLTTTTHLGERELSLADEHVLARNAADLGGMIPNGIKLITGPIQAGRAAAVDSDSLLWLHDISERSQVPLLIEADGSRQLPLKAPGAHEPALPDFVDLVVVVAGLSGLGKPLTAKSVHRHEEFAILSGLGTGQHITPEGLTRVLAHPAGGLKNIPLSARRVVMLNQADRPDRQAQALAMVPGLLEAFDAVIIAQIERGTIHAVHEATAGIVLAAGGSERLGRSKQLLDWHGQAFVRAVARTGLAAGLKPVVIVVGSEAEAVASAVAGLPVEVVQNEDWKSGQASSIKAGVRALAREAGSAVFLLADQPQVTFDVIRALIDAHAASLSPIVAPLVMMERRANPVLFDRETFPDLLRLEGDVGGRGVFSNHPVEYMPWHDDRLLLDVDTEEDYRRLVEDDTL